MRPKRAAHQRRPAREERFAADGEILALEHEHDVVGAQACVLAHRNPDKLAAFERSTAGT